MIEPEQQPINNSPSPFGFIGYYAQVVNQIGFPIVVAGVLLYMMLQFIPTLDKLSTAINQFQAALSVTNSSIVNQHKQMLDLLWEQQREFQWLMNARPSPLATPSPEAGN